MRISTVLKGCKQPELFKSSQKLGFTTPCGNGKKYKQCHGK